MNVLVLDDQRSARRILAKILAQGGYEILEAGSIMAAKTWVESDEVDVALVDIRLSDDPTDRGGLDFLAWLRSTGRSTPVVMVTASTELAEIREAMRQGAQDYVLKDELSREMLLPILDGLRERFNLMGEVNRLRERMDKTWGLAAIVGSSPGVERARKLIRRLANADAPVLIRGETGSGKELVARALHETGSRHESPFVAVNCSALPGTLIESIIFGHERGAFTGAHRRMRGQLELAGTGTVLLDEIAEMPVELQAKLLRVLEDHRFRPLGAEDEIPLKARILASTHVDLEARIVDGRFREDLFYRLNVVTIDIPGLSERREDIPELVSSFVSGLGRKLSFTQSAMTWLSRRGWPGNVRELKNAIERLALLSDKDQIDVGMLDELVGPQSTDRSAHEIDQLARAILAMPVKLGSKLDVIERAVLHHAIETCGGNKSAAARLLGVDRKKLERKWDKLSEQAQDSDSTGEDSSG